MSELAERMADFIELCQTDRYDERRAQEPWATIFSRWSKTYEASKRGSSFSEAARAATLEAANTLIALYGAPQPTTAQGGQDED
jgi:hypothetical protein